MIPNTKKQLQKAHEAARDRDKSILIIKAIESYMKTKNEVLDEEGTKPSSFCEVNDLLNACESYIENKNKQHDVMNNN